MWPRPQIVTILIPSCMTVGQKHLACSTYREELVTLWKSMSAWTDNDITGRGTNSNYRQPHTNNSFRPNQPCLGNKQNHMFGTDGLGGEYFLCLWSLKILKSVGLHFILTLWYERFITWSHSTTKNTLLWLLKLLTANHINIVIYSQGMTFYSFMNQINQHSPV